jgi:3-methyladenine DNA glycosylase AlkD
MVWLLDAACAARGREEMLLSTFLLARSRRRLTPALWPDVDRWVEGVDNWETCDQLATGVAGEIVAKAPALIGDLVTWTRSPNRWRRRFAASTTVALNQKSRRDPEAALRVCEPLLVDRDPMVVKAVGWTLREASQRDPAAVFTFLACHRATANPRTLREAAEKLPADARSILLDDRSGS